MVNEVTNRDPTLDDSDTLPCPTTGPFLSRLLQIFHTPAEVASNRLSLSVVKGTESESDA